MIQRPKGTLDVYGTDGTIYNYIYNSAQEIMSDYNFEFIKIPTFEETSLFYRGVGEGTDIVNKETYDFVDKGERKMTLRPEFTAGVIRSYIENKMYADNSVKKLWYFGSAFRYERPQSGRNREFTQFGVEAFGSSDPMLDAEVISIVVNLFKMLGLKGIKVNINTLGDSDSRIAYRKALIEYFKPHLDNLCDDCKSRYSKNPLRILDCKIDSKSDILKNAPRITDYLNETSKEHFIKVKEYLEAMEIDYVCDSNLVRGLDYYTHTVFEVTSEIESFGSQNVLGAGGRYDNLVETVGGPKTPGVGFAVGIERLLLALEAEEVDIIEDEELDVYVFTMDKEEKPYALSLVNTLRLNGFNVDMDFNDRNIKNNFKHADKLGTRFVIIIGKDEVSSKVLTIKNNKTKEEFKVKIDNIVEFLDEKLSEE